MTRNRLIISVGLAVVGTIVVAGSQAAAPPAVIPPAHGWSTAAWSQLPYDKQQKFGAVQAAIAARAHDASTKVPWLHLHPTASLPLANQGPSTPEVGILNMSQGPFPAGSFHIVNRWQALSGGILQQVFAGSEAATSNQGVVVTREVTWPGDSQRSANVYRTSTPTGALRIVAASGDDLTLASQTQMYTFNVTTGTLSSS